MALSVTGLPALVYVSVVGVTRYASPESVSRWRAFPSVTLATVICAFAVNAS